MSEGLATPKTALIQTGRFWFNRDVREMTREAIAYLLIGLVLVTGVPAAVAVLRRRHRSKLRRRGIKRYGH